MIGENGFYWIMVFFGFLWYDGINILMELFGVVYVFWFSGCSFKMFMKGMFVVVLIRYICKDDWDVVLWMIFLVVLLVFIIVYRFGFR